MGTFIFRNAVSSAVLEVDLPGHVDLAVLLPLVPQTILGHAHPRVVTGPVCNQSEVSMFQPIRTLTCRIVITLVVILLRGKLNCNLGSKGPQVSSKVIEIFPRS